MTRHVEDKRPPPVLLVGALRSGTTLLRLLLDRHPDVHWFGEFEYATRWCPPTGWPDVADYVRKLEVDRAFLRDDVRIDEGLDYPALVRSFLEQHRARGPAHEVFGCTVHARIDRLVDLWPGARFIHLLRDPRDVARSCVRMGWAGHPAIGVDGWVRTEQAWDLLRARLEPDAFHELTYERLVRDPETELTSLCAFLGLPFAPEMLDPGSDSTYGPPDASFAQRWPGRLGDRDVRRVEERVGPLLEARGYEPSGLPALQSGPLERAWVRVRSRVARARFGMRRYGLGLWLQRAISARVGTRKWRKAVRLRANAVDTAHLR